MSGRVKLQVIEGPMKGKEFVFEEHDAFLFGRMPDCHACFPNDQQVSRHHFIMEANPPDARIRDLGSLNGTYVDDVKYGSRKPGETPEEGARRQYTEVDLKSGSRIRVGQTILTVLLEGALECCQCGRSIPEQSRERSAWIGGTFICAECKAKLISMSEPVKGPEPVRCQKCGKDVSGEIGQARRGDYVCEACRKAAEEDPMKLLVELFRQAGRLQGGDRIPAIEGYEILKRLGKGAFGAVYLARRKTDKEQVAIKVMLAKVAVDENARNRFIREIEVVKMLHHDHVVSLFEHGSSGSGFYFVMELCEKGSVADLMVRRGGKLSLKEATPIMLQALDGLIYAHEQGIVHRDLKPQNLLLSGSFATRSAKVSDFGFAKDFEKAGFSGMTVTGAVAGTPPFMPREQVTNFKYVQPVSDVWSIAATFYNMLTGEFCRNFAGNKDPMEVILEGEIIPIRKRDMTIPKPVADVIDHALANKLEDRIQTVGEIKRELEKAL